LPALFSKSFEDEDDTLDKVHNELLIFEKYGKKAAEKY